ncbi:MAG: 16S rRNA (guanine(527)-N(7))-methyltransferase RsmG [Neisseriaceae bacterium]
MGDLTNARELLVNGIDKLELKINNNVVNELLKYVELLLKWNKTYNLTAIVDIKEVIKYHILDALTLIKYIEDNQLINTTSSLIDVGSGMGIPGIILAICYKDTKVEVLDSNNKKASFLKQVAIELGLHNLTVILSRIEKYLPDKKYDIITSRAFAQTQLFVNLSKNLIKENGCFLAMKSHKVMDELKHLHNYSVVIIEVAIPDVADKRFLVKISK